MPESPSDYRTRCLPIIIDGSAGDQFGVIFSTLLQPLPWLYVDLSILKVMFQDVGRSSDFERVLRGVDLYLTCFEMDAKQLQKMGWGHVEHDVQK